MFCQSQAFPTEKQPETSRFVWLFYFQKKPKMFKKSQNFKISLQKRQIGNRARLRLSVLSTQSTLNCTLAISYNYDARITFFLIAQVTQQLPIFLIPLFICPQPPV